MEKDETPDWLKEDETKPLPEAPASWTMKYWDGGFGCMLTIRSDKLSSLLSEIEYVMKTKPERWMPDWTKKYYDYKNRPKQLKMESEVDDESSS